MPDPAKTYHGRPCKHCGGTLRKRSNRHCIPCARRTWREMWAERYYADPEWAAQRRAEGTEWARRRRAADPEWAEREKRRKREAYHNLDHIAYYEKQLKSRRQKALKRQEARHGQVPD